jgi:hypothetical protein
MNYLWPKGLIQSAIASCLIVCTSWIGTRGFVGLGALPAASNWRYVTKYCPFAAAPVSASLMDPENFGCIKRKGPPPYTMVAFSNLSPVELTPSSPTLIPEYLLPDEGISVERVGTTGVAPLVATSCAKVNAWFPGGINKNELTAPTMNDSNAVVTLDITPPSEGSGGKLCGMDIPLR